MSLHRRATMGAALAALIVLAGCGGQSGTGSSPSPTGTRSTGASSGDVVRLSEADEGHTVQVHQGDRVVLTLHNTYWRIGPADGDVLTQIGSQRNTPAPAGTCRPGVGCGTVRASFLAAAVGNTTLRASRSSCGEAMACPPGEGHYVTHVVVG